MLKTPDALLQYSRHPKLAVVFSSVAVILVFWTVLPSNFQRNESKDYLRFYEPVARNLLSGNGLFREDGSPAIRYPPGFPLTLAGIFATARFFEVPEEFILSLFNLFCMAIASVFLFLIAKRIWGDLPAIVSTLVWITYPLALWSTKQPSSSVPFLVFFYGGFLIFFTALTDQKRRPALFFAAGALVGLSMLLRPIAIGATLVMATTLYVTGRPTKAISRIGLVIFMLLGNLVVIAPWELWAYTQTGKIIVLSSGGVPAVLDGLTYGARPEHRNETYGNVTKFMEEIEEARAATGNSLSVIASIVVDKLRTDPLIVAKLYALKAARAWYATDSGRFEGAIMLMQIPYLVLVAFGSIMAWRRGGVARQLMISVWLFVLYFWLMAITVLSIVRYMVPVIGLLFVVTPAIFLKQLTHQPH